MKNDKEQYNSYNLKAEVRLPNVVVVANSHVSQMNGMIKVAELERGDTTLTKGKKKDDGTYSKVAVCKVSDLPKSISKRIDDIFRSNPDIKRVHLVQKPIDTKLEYNQGSKQYVLKRKGSEAVISSTPLVEPQVEKATPIKKAKTK